MEPLLRVWCAVVDRLLPSYALSPLNGDDQAPGWRLQLYGGDGVGHAREVPVRDQIEIDDLLRAPEQRRLRGAFALLALARRVGGHAFLHAVTTAMPCTRPDSKTYHETKRRLLALGGLAPDDTEDEPLELWIQLEVQPGVHSPAKLTEMLRRIDRRAFVVTRMLVVLSPEAAPVAALPELFRAIHAFRDTADIDINMDAPAVSRDHTKLSRWKWFLDLAARQRYGELETSRPWTVTTVLGEHALGRRAGIASIGTTVASLAALAHAGPHIKTASITMALEDAGSERHVRAKYLGYLLRSGALETLGVRDQLLTAQDVELMLTMYTKDGTDDCLRALYEPAWRGRKARVLDDKSATKFLSNAREVLGVMHDLPDDDSEVTSETVDVFLAGYGQCGIKRALLPQVREMAKRPTAPATRLRSLKSLDLLFLSGRDTTASVVRLLQGGVGRELHKLQLEIEDGAYSLPQFAAVLEACPTLRTLLIKPLRIGHQDDRRTFGAPAPREPLQSLTIELTAAFAESAGLAGLCRLLGSYASQLREFMMFAEQRVVADRAYVAPVNAFFAEQLPKLHKMRIVGFTSGYLRSLWSCERTGLRELNVLMLENSLHTLHVKVAGWENLDALQAALDTNTRLVNVAINVREGTDDRAAFIQRAQATNGRHVGHVTAPLSVRHKAAFLSAVAKTNLPIESHNLNTIFDFAAATETRYVRVHLATTQQQSPFF